MTESKKTQTSKKIKKGDNVIVITGNCKGQQGPVIKKDGDRVVVQGVNLRKKHVKKNQQNPQGSIIDIECPIHISNVMLCVNDKPQKLKVKINSDHSKSLIYRDGGKEVVYRDIKKASA